MRIAIASQNACSIEALRRVILSVKGLELAWIAQNGAGAIDSCARDSPDLVLLDLEISSPGGKETTGRITACSPCAVLIVTKSVNGNPGAVFDALGAGAVDAVTMPDLPLGGTVEGAAALIAKIRMVGRLIGVPKRRPPIGRAPGLGTTAMDSSAGLVVIGASAGGPAALAAILMSIPPDFPAGVVIVQHMDAAFVRSMASWLSSQCALPIRVAERHDRPDPGTALIAGTNDHLLLTEAGELDYSAAPGAGIYRPSIDVLFESVAVRWKGAGVGLLLTGMGTDGALGLRALRSAGFLTVAQDRDTSAVYGMPKAAVGIGAVDLVLPLDKIAERLINAFTPGSRRRRPARNDIQC